MAYKVPVTPQKTQSQQLAESVATLMIAFFVGWVLEKLFGWLFNPFETTGDLVIEDHLNRESARGNRVYKFSLDKSDPMSQFQERFIKNPGDWKRHPDNAMYKDWYTRWKQGKVIDTQLRWAPRVTLDEDGIDSEIRSELDLGGQFNGSFINYLDNQVELHREVSGWRRSMFLGVIRRYYPEFQSSWEGLEEDIAAYQGEIEERAAIIALYTAYKERGMPRETWASLAASSAGRLEDSMSYMTTCMGMGADPSTAVAMCEAGAPLQKESVELSNIICQKLFLPAKAVTMFWKEEIDMEGLSYLSEKMNTYFKIFGGDIFSPGREGGESVFMELFDGTVKQLNESKRSTKVDKACQKKSTTRR